MGTFDTSNPYDRRRWWRQHLPWFLIDLGIADKGTDCEAVGGKHLWYNRGEGESGCYYCKVVRAGRLWEDNPEEFQI